MAVAHPRSWGPANRRSPGAEMRSGADPRLAEPLSSVVGRAPELAEISALLHRRAMALADAAGELVILSDALSAIIARAGAADKIARAEADLHELVRASAAAAATAAAQSGDGALWRARMLDELAIAEEEEDAVGVMSAELGLGWIALGSCDVAAIRQHASSMLGREGWPHGSYACTAAWLMIQAALLEGDAARAGQHADDLARRAARLPNRRALALADVGRGRAALLEGEDKRAEALLQRGLEPLLGQAYRIDQADVIEALGAVAARQERWVRAVRLLAAVAVWRTRWGLFRLPPHDAYWDEIADEARGVIGTGKFETAWQQWSWSGAAAVIAAAP
jgi:hypothetical protein